MIAVIDYGLGNIGSIVNALDRLGQKSCVTNNTKDILQAKVLIFPGDGAAGKAMENLEKIRLIRPIRQFISSGKPFLGICLGMQILLDFSEEGNTNCLGVVKGVVKKFNSGLKVPQIGWNQIKIKNEKLKMKNLFKDISNKSYFYFINSYYCEPKERKIIVAETEYGEKFCSVFVKDNIVGVQFHPERSGKVGMQFLKNWISYVN